jgi:hypothetical protein
VFGLIWRRLFFAQMVGSNACAVTPFGRSLAFSFPRFVLFSRHRVHELKGTQFRSFDKREPI